MKINAVVCSVIFSCALLSLHVARASASVASTRAEAAANNLMSEYKNGQWADALWWENANVLVSIIQYSVRTNNQTFLKILPAVYNEHKDFNIEGFDDEGWWGLAWIEAYKATHDNTYLTISENIWTDLKTAWDTTCGGGVWWDRKRTYKNAVTNELFLALSAGLYLQTKNSLYLQWAQNEWNWFKTSTLINAQNQINDGLSNCKNNGQTLWTYNQGVVLGGLVDLYKATNQADLIHSACLIANATITGTLTRGGILQETCEPSKGCNNDQATFKGMFMRNLGYLYEQTKIQAYAEFITKNTDSIWNNDRGAGNALGLYWSGPFDTKDPKRQSSALEALNAALLI